MTEPTPTPPENPHLVELRAYLVALKNKRMEILTGAQSYSIGSRSLARYAIELKELNNEIAKTEKEIALIVNGLNNARMKHMIYHDFP